MSFIKKPVTGMRDILPEEMELRNYLMDTIREVYESYGFSQMEAPVVAHIENLTSKQGGDNEKLIFRIMKRGEKLAESGESLKDGDFDALTDSGLRYDLTVPLSRYYSNNQAKLQKPFKALQIGPVFRADRPQKGRFRQFVQCDIDIFGDPTNLAEKELILATTEALSRIGIDKYGLKVYINDRRILFGMVSFAGFPAEDAEKILIVLDKADKIGAEGVDEELRSMGYAEESISKLRSILDSYKGSADSVRAMGRDIDNEEIKAACENVADIMESIAAMKSRNISLCFDPTLVRGMGYYTGTIFEAKVESFGSSVCGGGRYDKMIGRFTGQDVPAVGFSIGFERIVTILLEGGCELPKQKEKLAVLMEKGMSPEKVGEIFELCEEERRKGRRVFVAWMAKNKKFQKEGLANEGYGEIREFFNN